MFRLSQHPTIDTASKLVAVSIAMFAFVFVVMVPLYNVLCDALGINGKTSDEAYIAISTEVDVSRAITVQFVTSNNNEMPWGFKPSVTMMTVNPGAANDTVFLAANGTNKRWWRRLFPVFRLPEPPNTFTRPSVFALTSSPSTPTAARKCRCNLLSIRRYRET